MPPFTKPSTPLTLFPSFLVTVLLFLIDLATGNEIAFSIFYLIPVFYVAYFTGHRIWTIIFCALGAAAWLAADLFGGSTYSHFLIPVWNMIMRFSFFIITGLLLIRQHELLEREHELARVDSLTNIGNTRYFYETCEREIHRSVRHNRPFVLIYFDVDNFKPVNDNFGHPQGDNLLRLIAVTTQSTIRKTDVLGRMGGDEFAVLMPELSLEQANLAIGRLQYALLNAVKRERYAVTFSFGMTVFYKPPNSVDEMISVADQLMYKAKKEGKNRVRSTVIK
jgi:diguanylate cyclase (GGDEF)-like protein